ncbi:MAG: hypothetical protein DELT_02641 [Desulfovibrio sp.]
MAATAFTVGACLLKKPETAALACLFPALLLPFSGISAKRAAKRLAAVNFFFLFLWATLPVSLTERPDTFASFGPLYLHTAGLLLAAVITLKGNAAALALIALLDSSTVTANARALLRLGAPRKFVTLLLLTHANLHLMNSEKTRLFRAAKLRGFAPRCSAASIRTYAWLTGMILIRSWRRTKRVGDAMRLKSFVGIFPLLDGNRTAFRPLLAGLLVLAAIALPVALHLYEYAGEVA